MLKPVPYTETQISELRSDLKQLQARPKALRKASKRALVEELSEELLRGRKLGYTLKELAELLAKRGIEIRADLLGQYLRASRKEPPGAKMRARSTARSAEETPSAHAMQTSSAVTSETAETESAKAEAKAAETAQKPSGKRVGKASEPTRAINERGGGVTANPSGKLDTNATPQAVPRGMAVSSGGFTPRPDTDDI